MHTEGLLIDERCQWQVVEYFCAVAPYVDWAVLAETLIIKAVDLCDLSGFVISSDKGDAVWVSYFQRKQQQKCLHTVEAPINEVPHEEVVCARTVSPNLKELHQIKKLAVNVAAYRDRRVDAMYVRLFYQDVLRHIAKLPSFWFLDKLTSLELGDLSV